MKATHTIKGIPVSIVTFKAVVSALHLEIAVIAIFTKGKGPTKKLIKEEILNMIRIGGLDGASDWVSETDYEEYIEKARNVTRKLYPTFYKTT